MQTIKQELLELCQVQVAFWEKFRKEVELISDEDDINVIEKWNSFFKDNVEAVHKLIDKKMSIEHKDVQEKIKQGLIVVS